MNPYILSRSQRRRGFALIAAIGVLAALFLIVVAADSAVNRGLRQSHRAFSISKNLETCEAAAQTAVRDYLAALKQNADPAIAIVSSNGDDTIATDLLPLTETDAMYSNGVLIYREGDFRVETKIDGKMRAVWLINSRNGSKRVILLERKA